jgi:hypothetical protein
LHEWEYHFCNRKRGRNQTPPARPWRTPLHTQTRRNRGRESWDRKLAQILRRRFESSNPVLWPGYGLLPGSSQSDFCA